MTERIKGEKQKYNPDLEPQIVNMNLGQEVFKTDNDIPSTIEGFHCYPDVKVEYPPQIIDALKRIFQEYNSAFTKSVSEYLEFKTDYQYLFNPEKNQFYNPFVQIDMAGLTPEFIKNAELMDPNVLTEEE